METKEFLMIIIRNKGDYKKYSSLKRWSINNQFDIDMFVEYSKEDKQTQIDYIMSPEGNNTYWNIFWCHAYNIKPLTEATSRAMKVFDEYMFDAELLFGDLEGGDVLCEDQCLI